MAEITIMHVVKAGAVYFALVFGAGFVLGIEPWGEPSRCDSFE
jgi:hypothetical protein